MLSPQFLIVSLIAGLELLSLADGDPMIEVFRWKQMDFYNRGDVHPVLGGRRDRPSHSGEFKKLNMCFLNFRINLIYS